MSVAPQAPYNTNLSGSPGKFQSTTASQNVATAMYGITFLLPNAQGTQPFDTTPTNFQSYTYDCQYGGSSDTLTISITSSWAPAWGDFFADGGDWTNHYGWLMGHNNNYGVTAAQAFVDGTALPGYVPVPAVATVPASPTLTVSNSGTGSGIVTSAPSGINCGSTCSARYSTGTAVTLTAAPDAGSAFTGWSGACQGAGDTCVVTMAAVTATETVTANYSIADTGIPLSPGWNLISLPVQPTDIAASAVLAGIAGALRVVWAYPNQSWEFYDPNDPEGSTLTTLEAGMGYWVEMTTANTLSLSGSTPSSSLSLLAGWNLVGYSGASCAAVTSALSSIASTIQVSWGYPGQAWKVYDPNDPNGSTLARFCPNSGYGSRDGQGHGPFRPTKAARQKGISRPSTPPRGCQEGLGVAICCRTWVTNAAGEETNLITHLLCPSWMIASLPKFWCVFCLTKVVEITNLLRPSPRGCQEGLGTVICCRTWVTSAAGEETNLITHLLWPSCTIASLPKSSMAPRAGWEKSTAAILSSAIS